MKKILILFFLIHFTYSSEQKYSFIGNLSLSNGDTLYDCKVGFRTFGKLNSEKSNAIVFCTWYMGFSEDLIELIGEKSFIDSNKYFVIAIDALGNGESTSPSNYNKLPANNFPEISIKDMVNSQYKMITKEFGIKSLFGIIGGSMGGMQVFEWISSYPNFIKKAVIYVGSPRLSSYDRLIFTIQKKIIEDGTKYNVSEIDQTQLYSMVFSLVLRSPEHINKNIEFKDFSNYISSFRNDTISNSRFQNLKSQLQAMIKHDIWSGKDENVCSITEKINSELFIIVAENDLTINPEAAIKFSEITKSKLLILKNDCGHLAPGCEHEKVSKEIRDFFNN